MNFKQLLIALSLAFTLTACSNASNPQDANTEPPTVTSFEECVAAGNPVMESYPRQCKHGDETFAEKAEAAQPAEGNVPCAEETGATKPDCLPPVTDMPNNDKPCTREFRPVCGEIQVQCVKAPCDNIRTTFANRCEAENAGATNIAEGACVDEEPNPEGACLSFDGTWLPETKECEGMAKEQCEALGGTYNECASACRNDPNAEMCIQMCVQVCQFS